jgi:hypothetical protein
VINALDLPEEPVSVQVVDVSGAKVWTGQTEIRNGQARVVLPRFDSDGSFFIRLYSASSLGQSGPILLQEFAFRVQSNA